MFFLDEKVVYPGHGVAKIARIVEKVIGNNVIKFFELRLINKDMTVLVPIDNVKAAGIRRLSSRENIDAVFRLLAQPAKRTIDHEVVGNNWNKRNKEYQVKLRTGNLIEICKIYRDLKSISCEKELSFGERALLQQTEMLLAEEISAVKNFDENKALEHLRSLVTQQDIIGQAPVSSISQVQL